MTAVLSPPSIGGYRAAGAHFATSPIVTAPTTTTGTTRRIGFRDRTNELRSIFDLIRQSTTPSISDPKRGQQLSTGADSNNNNSSTNSNNTTAGSFGIAPRKKPAPQQTQEMRAFNDSASRFSNDLAQLAGTVANLTRLTQQGSGGSVGGSDAFEENSTEISRLTQVVRTRLGALHDDLNTLADLKQASSESMHSATIAKHNESVVSSLRSKLVGTGNTFRAVLQKRTQAMKDASNRRSRLLADRSSVTNSFDMAPAAGGSSSSSSAMFRGNQQYDDSGSTTEGAAASATASSTALVSQHRQSNLSYLRDRQAAVHEIEVAVREVSEIVQDFNRLVYEQDEFIVRIDDEVEQSLHAVTEGSGQLMQYLASLTSQRGFILKVLGILFLFLLFFGFFVVR